MHCWSREKPLLCPTNRNTAHLFQIPQRRPPLRAPSSQLDDDGPDGTKHRRRMLIKELPVCRASIESNHKGRYFCLVASLSKLLQPSTPVHSGGAESTVTRRVCNGSISTWHTISVISEKKFLRIVIGLTSCSYPSPGPACACLRTRACIQCRCPGHACSSRSACCSEFQRSSRPPPR